MSFHLELARREKLWGEAAAGVQVVQERTRFRIKSHLCQQLRDAARTAYLAACRVRGIRCGTSRC